MGLTSFAFLYSGIVILLFSSCSCYSTPLWPRVKATLVRKPLSPMGFLQVETQQGRKNWYSNGYPAERLAS